eukprot:g19774.t1
MVLRASSTGVPQNQEARDGPAGLDELKLGGRLRGTGVEFLLVSKCPNSPSSLVVAQREYHSPGLVGGGDDELSVSAALYVD